MRLFTTLCSAMMLLGTLSLTTADTYRVGPGRSDTEISDVTGSLSAGDTVLVDGDNTYASGARISADGTQGNPIVIMGDIAGGASRPILAGSSTYGIEITGDNVILEGFEVDAMAKGIGVFADNITVRSCVIHDCNHGLVGYGTGTGNVTVEYCEFYGNGVSTGGATQHQIYMATDEDAHPGSVFRLQYCYLHDGSEGDNVKSRSERNEIYYNWVELAGTSGHGLGLFAPDPEDNSSVNINTAREDADVVGNVIIQARNSCARIGGDAPGYPTNGRYRFVNNTFILTTTRGDAIRTFNVVETLEMYNNVIYGASSGADIRVLNDADGDWVHTPRSVTGSHNWVVEGATRMPTTSEWSNTIRGSASPFADAESYDYMPDTSAGLYNAGTASTPPFPQYGCLNPLHPPAYHPPVRELIAVGSEETRPTSGTIDIGAFEASSQAVYMDHPGGRRLTTQQLGGNRLTGPCVYGADGRLIGVRSHKSSGLRLVRDVITDGARKAVLVD